VGQRSVIYSYNLVAMQHGSLAEANYESLVLTKGSSLIRALHKILIEGLSNFFLIWLWCCIVLTKVLGSCEWNVGDMGIILCIHFVTVGALQCIF